ncbi:MAG: ribonuclease Z [Clostridiales bacterium]|nr:ribonuclease Z [Clostridiales bacterium]
MVELCLLGTGGTLPLADRALSSMYVRVNGRAMLVDCGEGTQVGIRRLGWGFRCLEGLVLTHFHGDHCTGLPGLLLSLEKAGKEDPFDIYGPAGLKRVTEGLCVIVPKLSYAVRLHEFPPAGAEFEMIGLKIRAFPVNHGIPCYGFRMELERKGAFDPERATALKVPMREWKTLQAGESVRVGLKKIHPEDVLGPERKGITVVFSTDTRPCETLDKYAAGADLAVLEGMYASGDKMPQALKNHHMMFREAAEIAKAAGVNRLALTHFSTSLEDPEAEIGAAAEIFPETVIGRDGMIFRLNYPQDREPAAITVRCKEDW